MQIIQLSKGDNEAQKYNYCTYSVYSKLNKSNAVKPAHVLTSIKSPVSKGHLY